MISGWSALDFAPNLSTQTLCPKASLKEDYYFSKYNHIWGWASWARAWSKYQLEFGKEDIKTLDNFCSKREKTIWHRIFKTYAQGKKACVYIQKQYDKQHLDLIELMPPTPQGILNLPLCLAMSYIFP